jgi:hypothetical protein
MRKIMVIFFMFVFTILFTSCDEIYDAVFGSTSSTPVQEYYYAKEDGIPDWETFFSHVKECAKNYNYIFIRKENTDIYREYSLNSRGNNYFYYYEDGVNYQIILRNDDPNYFGTVRRFNGTQADAAISYFNEQLPNILRDILQWLLLY